MFTFTPLLGARGCAGTGSQSVLELDGSVKVLVDVGWDSRFDTRQLAELEKHVPSLSFILITHPTISHLGAFAHCCKHIPLFVQIPVYATAPVIAFGRTLLQDLYSSAPTAATFVPATKSPEDDTSSDDAARSNILRQAPSFEDIHRYFSRITPLKYSQPHQPSASYFSAPLEGLTLTAYNAGHTLGGTIWHIQYGMESIVYAVDWHQARENVIAGAAWFGGVGGGEVIEQLRKPTALVCSSINGDKIALSGGRKERDEELIAHIRSSIAKGGTVLIPSDSSARVLEITWLLEKMWHEAIGDETIRKTKLYFASKSGHATLRHARSLLEWMDDSIVREFEGDEEVATKTHKRSGSKQTNGSAKAARPFEFRHVKVVERKTQLERLLKSDGPRVIIASDCSFEWGFSRAMLQEVASKTENLVIFTESADQTSHDPLTMQQKLWQWFRQREDGIALEKTSGGLQLEQIHTGGRQLEWQRAETAPLNDAELSTYQQYLATARQIQESLAMSDNRQLAAPNDALDDNDDGSSSESDESEDEQQGRALNVSAALGHGNRNKMAIKDEDLGVSILMRRKGVHDYDVRSKRGRNAVFPYMHSRRRGDEYGDFIKPEDFLREEEKEEQGGLGEKDGSLVGQKRKWDEQHETRTAGNKRHQPRQGERGDAAGEIDEDGSDASEASDDEKDINTQTADEPSKAVFSNISVTFNARLAFVDFAGIHDQRSLQLLIPLVGPKKLILVGGSLQETAALASDCKELLGVKVAGADNRGKVEIFSPAAGESVDASVDTNAWIVRLSRELAKRLQWQNVKNIGIVTIMAQLIAEHPTGSGGFEQVHAKRLKLEDDAQSKDQNERTVVFEPVLEPIPANLAASTRSGSQPIHVGDLRLADLRRLMVAAGHSAEFRGEGTLLVDNMIAVRKHPDGKIMVEGTPVSSITGMNMRGSDSFSQVRRRIYEGLAVVAAG